MIDQVVENKQCSGQAVVKQWQVLLAIDHHGGTVEDFDLVCPVQVNSNLGSEKIRVLDLVPILYSSHWPVVIILRVLSRDHLLRDRERVLLVPDFRLANYVEDLILESV